MSGPNVARYKQHEAGDLDPTRSSHSGGSVPSTQHQHQHQHHRSSSSAIAPMIGSETMTTTIQVHPHSQKQLSATSTTLNPVKTNEYEFSETQGHMIEKTSANMLTTSIASSAMSVFIVTFAIISTVRGTMSVFGLIVQLGYSFIFAVVCLYTWRSAKFLHAVANSEGRDITFLMAFMTNLQSLFMILKYVLLMAAVMLLIACILNIILATQNQKDKC